MTKNQVTAALNDFEYAPNVWLELKEIAYIITDADEAIYPNPASRFLFDDTLDLLVIWNGYVDAQGNFVRNATPEYLIDYELIIGFVSVSKGTPAFGYQIGRR